MRFATFAELSHTIWDGYFTGIYADDLLGRLDAGAGVTLYPTMLVCTQTDDHYIAELIGASRNYQGLNRKTHREQSTVRYLSQFTDEAPDPAISLGGARNQFRNLTLTQGVAIDTITARFPFATLYKTVLHRAGGNSALVDFTTGFESAAFENCVFVNQHAAAIRVKHVLFMAVTDRDLPAAEYEDFLRENVLVGNEVRGVHTVGKGEAEDFAVAGQFASVFLWPGLRETSIGEFLHQHPRIIERALGTRRILHEPTFEWRDAAHAHGDSAINPDMLIERSDGSFDIYDLKLLCWTATVLPRVRDVAEGLLIM